MKSRDEILELLRAVRADLDLRRSYGGPDPDERGTADLMVEARTLSWVLNKELGRGIS